MTDTFAYHKDNTNWHYIDLEKYEQSIRQEMINAEIDRRRRNRQRKAVERSRKLARKKYFAIQKIIGLMLILCTVLTAVLTKNTDITFAFITVPIGMLLMFSKEKCLIKG